MEGITKEIIFIAFLSYKIQNLDYSQSIYVYMKYHSNQSLFTQLCLCSLTVTLIFPIFTCFFFQIP